MDDDGTFFAKVSILKGTLIQVWNLLVSSSSYENNTLKIVH